MAGLDSRIKQAEVDQVQETRSLLYRGFTRAHMMVCVVNELLPGGWLQFLTRATLDNNQDFDANAAKKMLNPNGEQMHQSSCRFPAADADLWRLKSRCSQPCKAQ